MLPFRTASKLLPNTNTTVLSLYRYGNSVTSSTGRLLLQRTTTIFQSQIQRLSSSANHVIFTNPLRPEQSPSCMAMMPQQLHSVAVKLQVEAASMYSKVQTAVTCILQDILDISIWYIKRTFQPSILRRKRKHGFLQRHKTVGGRRVLKRRKLKGRVRLA